MQSASQGLLAGFLGMMPSARRQRSPPAACSSRTSLRRWWGKPVGLGIGISFELWPDRSSGLAVSLFHRVSARDGTDNSMILHQHQVSVLLFSYFQEAAAREFVRQSAQPN
jgi:hypothetical protein